MSRWKSGPSLSSERSCPTRPSSASATFSTSLIEATVSLLVRNCLTYNEVEAIRGTSEEVAERSEIEVEVAVLEPELGLQLLHPLRELHEGLAEPLDLVVRQGSVLHAAERLPLHQLAQELDEREHELGQAALDPLRIGVDSVRERVADLVELTSEPVDVPVRREHMIGQGAPAHSTSARLGVVAAAKLYGGHGPVQIRSSSGCDHSSFRSALRNAST